MRGARVQAVNVSRVFSRGSGEVWAVRDVSLAIEPGQVLALVGRSGSGKTTLLNILGGLDRPTSGEVHLDERRLDTMPEAELTQLRRTELGFVFQSFGLLPLLSAQENVELPLRIAGYKQGDRVRRAREALELVGLTKRANHRPYELSGGEQQRVAIARALTCEPKLILADEPTGELDSLTARAVFGLLRDLAHRDGITVITCTHDRLVMEMADRVEELSDGSLVAGHLGDVWEHTQGRSSWLPQSQTPANEGAPPVPEPGAKFTYR
jgi:putative ABC transport system ATP-binding protein